MNTHTLLLLLGLTAAPAFAAGQRYQLRSPDKRITVTVTNNDRLSYSVRDEAGSVLEPSDLSMTLASGETWGRKSRIENVKRRSVDETLPSPLYKKSQVRDAYNELRLTFRNGFAVTFRAYDDGVAYRFTALRDEPFAVENEEARFRFAEDSPFTASYVRLFGRESETLSFEEQFGNSFENYHTYTPFSQKDSTKLMLLPAAAQLPGGRIACITEVNLEAYPGMYLNGKGDREVEAVFAPYPKTKHRGGWHEISWIVDEREPYIAKADGARDFPWRAVAIASSHRALIENDLVYKLADPCRLDDISWIKPGKSAYEWWSAWAISEVPFRVGANPETYEYMIDFAAKNNLEYIMLESGWNTRDSFDLFEVTPTMDLERIVRYADRKGVGVLLWAGYRPFERDMEKACKVYSEMGFKGFKLDFMDSDHQQIAEFLYKAAETTAKYKMVLDFHGVHKPTGFQRTYPHVLNYEGAFNMEQVKWTQDTDMPRNDVTVGFVRMVAGPTDYLSGAMLNAVPTSYRSRTLEPMSQGTRCHQLGFYVVFDGPLVMLADSPNHYDREPLCTKFLAEVPTVWDDTKGIDGAIGEYIVTARRKGDVWYLGGLTNWDERNVEANLSFLPAGDYRVELYRDGVNADRIGSDFIYETFDLGAARTLPVALAPGGGFVAKFVPKR